MPTLSHFEIEVLINTQKIRKIMISTHGSNFSTRSLLMMRDDANNMSEFQGEKMSHFAKTANANVPCDLNCRDLDVP